MRFVLQLEHRNEVHHHPCPTCYEQWVCVEDCTIEPDLSDDGPSGSHAPCPECTAHAARIRRCPVCDSARTVALVTRFERDAYSRSNEQDLHQRECTECDHYFNVRGPLTFEELCAYDELAALAKEGHVDVGRVEELITTKAKHATAKQITKLETG